MYVLIYFYLSHKLIVSKNYFFLIQKEKKNFISKNFYLSKKLILKLYKKFFYFKHLDFLILFSLEKGLFLNRN
jgi:hypothetical protein